MQTLNTGAPARPEFSVSILPSRASLMDGKRTLAPGLPTPWPAVVLQDPRSQMLTGG